MSVDDSHAVAASNRTLCGATWKSRSSLRASCFLLTAQPSTIKLSDHACERRDGLRKQALFDQNDENIDGPYLI